MGIKNNCNTSGTSHGVMEPKNGENSKADAKTRIENLIDTSDQFRYPKKQRMKDLGTNFTHIK